MKKLLSLIALIFLMSNLFAQKLDEKSVPADAVKNFNTKYTQATLVKWEKEGTLFKAVFTQNELKTKAFYTETGQWVSSEWEIPAIYAPKAITEYITANLVKFKIKELTIVEEDKSTVPGKYYKAEVTDKKVTKTLKFNLKGEIIPETPEKK